MSQSSGGTPPGWYPDGQGGQRWWDGTQWAAPSQPPQAPQAPQAPQGPPATPSYGTPAPQYGAPQYGAPTPQYGAPAYGSPAPQYGAGGTSAGGSSGSGGSRKGLFVILAAVVAVIVIFCVTAFAVPGFLTGSDGPASAGSDPKGTVEAFLDAAKTQDCDAVKDLVTDNLRSQIEAQGCGEDTSTTLPDGSTLDPSTIETTIGDSRIDGDTATVPVTEKLPEGSGLPFSEVVLDYLLVKQDGSWLIDDFQPEGLPGLDDLPTDFGSDFPTDAFPTDGFPTDGFPTDGLPSDFLSDLPSDFFSDLPTDFPTDFLTDLPSGYPTG